ncbi:MAG: hypothetical protein WGN25_03840 [Candidatus Electrothrix sp. GW3-4]|uniref:hypothetical protein n=1 Tax=Candidatus Electrothrix sp. GW3-4 TaxID=3126740 RepID=UPI0030D0DD45
MNEQKDGCAESQVLGNIGVEQPKEMTRRQALAALGKFAAFSAPMTITLLAAEDVLAWSPPDPPSEMPIEEIPPELIPWR